jgi:hypothetical protein
MFIIKRKTFINFFKCNYLLNVFLKIIGFVFLLPAVKTYSQSPYILRNSVEHHIFDRIEIMQLSDTFLMSSVNNTEIKNVMEILLPVWENSGISDKEKFNLKYLFQKNIEFLPDKKTPDESGNSVFKNNYIENTDYEIMDREYFNRNPILKYFYKTQAFLWHLETPSFSLYVNPVLNFQYSNEQNNSDIIFQNTRGAELKGYIDKKVYFYAQILENQRSFPSYIQNSIDKFQAIPGQGFSKLYQSSVIDKLNGYDYFNARTYVGFNPVKSIQLELGHGNHFIGNGIRSLLLSDFSHNYFYLKMNTKIWKFHYQNLFNELSPISTLVSRGGDNLLPKKYTATHYLAFRPNHQFELGLFETVIFERENHFEFQYLNPLILYRAVEHFLGSPDNVMLGLNAKWNFLKRFSLYGQILLDELNTKELFKNSGWWANKFGGQIGVKYINAFGIDQLDLQLEYNVVNPYTYSHRDTLPGFPQFSVANYSNHNQPLAHPLGANFRELIGIIKYKPSNSLYLQTRIISALYGEDKDGLNYGQNILISNDTRPNEYGNFIGQGNKTTVINANFDVSYAFYHNCFIDAKYLYRLTRQDKTTGISMFSIGLRINLPDIPIDY